MTNKKMNGKESSLATKHVHIELTLVLQNKSAS